ncbi:glycoside hydrolase family 78 protein [Nonomuraea sp. NBC_00507]|uniref:family 78 glycoside hydrolase catalytic domain n=1 Tax=Nonomuraea sp. NBC_00507 TaxID=2976002 RepID=UPI002E198F01
MDATNPRTCDMTDPLGVETARPVLSWQLTEGAQTAYHVVVDGLWDSGEVVSPDQRVAYDGTPLGSRERATWRVRVRDPQGRWSGWSESARFEMGLLHEEDWTASWITHPDWPVDDPRGGEGHPLPLLAREFTLDEPVDSARLHIAGLGIYVATLNDAVVSDALAPPYTDARKRVVYATHDVTDLLRPGTNELVIELGPGITHVYPHQDRYMKFFGSQAAPRAIAQLEAGSTRICTDASWRAAGSATIRSHWYGGEDHDARREPSGRRPAAVVDAPATALRSSLRPPITVVDRLPGVRLAAADGTPVFDVGTVIAGWPELELDLPAGHHLRVVPGDQLDAYGRVVQSKPTTGAPIFNTYITRDGAQTWHPRFRYDGFRYVEVQGLPAGKGALTGLVLRAGNARTGEFGTSDELINGIHTIIDRAIQGNMYSVLTDCPHREKLGWLEQVHLLFDVVAYNYDVAAYCRELLVTIAEAQTPEGLVPDIAPEYVVFEGAFRDDPNWGSALVHVPWQLYRWYGDTTALETHFDAMARYVGYLTGRADGGLLRHGLGDWLAPDPTTPVELVSTWGYWRAVRTMARAAEVLGRDAKPYHALADHVAAAFAREYAPGSQASGVLALDLGVAPEAELDRVCASLKDGVTVGEVVLPALFRVLGRAGRHEELWEFARRTDHPSYGYQVRHGATALTEAWDGPTRGLSQNHYMLGAIDAWFYRHLAGIGQAPGSAGFRRLLVEPAVPGELAEVRAATATPYGRVAVAWQRDEDGFHLEVDVPPGSTAEVRLPVPACAPAGTVALGPRAFEVPAGHWRFG